MLSTEIAITEANASCEEDENYNSIEIEQNDKEINIEKT